MFSGVSCITLFEIIEGFFMLFCKLVLRIKNGGPTSNVVEVQELQIKDSKLDEKLQDMEKKIQDNKERLEKILNDIFENTKNKKETKNK